MNILTIPPVAESQRSYLEAFERFRSQLNRFCNREAGSGYWHRTHFPPDPLTPSEARALGCMVLPLTPDFSRPWSLIVQAPAALVAARQYATELEAQQLQRATEQILTELQDTARIPWPPGDSYGRACRQFLNGLPAGHHRLTARAQYYLQEQNLAFARRLDLTLFRIAGAEPGTSGITRTYLRHDSHASNPYCFYWIRERQLDIREPFTRDMDGGLILHTPSAGVAAPPEDWTEYHGWRSHT